MAVPLGLLRSREPQQPQIRTITLGLEFEKKKKKELVLHLND